ncbi:DUF1642 domain-containing protein [Streptococcus suis]
MNKQEAINELMSKSREIIFGDDENVYLSRKRTIELISQIHEPQKVVVPKFVALRIEKYKDSNKPLYQLLDLSDDKEFNDWFLPNGEVDASRCDVLARAWLDGYTIEQEKLYIVEFQTGQQLYKNYPSGSSKEQIVIKFANPKDKDGHFIKWELEEAGFGWVFDCSGVKVVEVE